MTDKKDLRGNLIKMREVAEFLNAWADDLEKTLQDKGAGVASDTETKEMKLAEVREILTEKHAAGFKEQVKALIESYGVTSLRDVPPEHYRELAEAAAALGAGEEEADAG